MSNSEGAKRRRSRRRGGGGNGKGQPKDGAAARTARRTAMYRRKIDEQLFGKKSERPRLRMEQRLRDAHRTPNLQRTFREYVKAHGVPGDASLLLMLLDLEEERDLLQVAEGIDGALASEGVTPEQKSVLRSRLRNLEMSTGSDAVADAAAGLLERL